MGIAEGTGQGDRLWAHIEARDRPSAQTEHGSTVVITTFIGASGETHSRTAPHFGERHTTLQALEHILLNTSSRIWIALSR